jgi:hypothetical protein
MGSGLDTNPVVQRSKRKTTRRRFARCEVEQRFLYLHHLFLVSAIAGGSSGSVSLVRKYVVVRKMSPRDANPHSWRKAYGLALSLFAVEVALLYLFTLRFS